jgi:hypothetical protein
MPLLSINEAGIGLESSRLKAARRAQKGAALLLDLGV